MRRLMIQFLFTCYFILTACATMPVPAEPTLAPTATALASQSSPTVIPTITPTVTPTEVPPAMTCADLDGAWGAEDWGGVLDVLVRLEEEGMACGEGDMASKRYAAHINYGEFFEAAGDDQAAIAQYELALALRLGGVEALRSLARLGSPPEPTPVACDRAELAA